MQCSKRFALLAALLIFAVTGCNRKSNYTITVKNAGKGAVGSVTLSGQGQKFPLGNIAPGGTAGVTVTARPGATFAIRFQDEFGLPASMDPVIEIDPRYKSQISIELSGADIATEYDLYEPNW